MKTELRLTDTNAASDSQGRTWGLEGNLFWYLVGGLGVGVTTFFICIVVAKVRFAVSFGFALIPVLLALAYIYGFRQGRPPGYDRDCLEYWANGPGFSPMNRTETKHPLLED